MTNHNSHADLVLIRPNSKKIMYHGVLMGATAVDPPYWLAVMGGYLRNTGIDVVLIDAEAAEQTPEETAEEVRNLHPKLAGVLTLGSNLTASTWTMPGAGILCWTIKEAVPNLPVFLWGNHPSALPERTLREEAVDYVIVGEGFDTIKELFHFCNKRHLNKASIRGLQYLEDSKLCGDGRVRVIDNLSFLPVDGWDLFPSNQQNYRNHLHFAFEDLSRRGQYGAILTSLGCPYNCAYCAIRTFSGNTRGVRYKSLEAAIAEVDYWVNKRNIYYLRIMDECFTINRKFAMDFCRLLKKRNYKLSIWINARIDTVDKEFLLTMYDAGIRWLGYGIESGSVRIRGIVNKEQYNYEKTKEIVELTKKCGLYICGNVMFGLPGEKLEDMQADLQMIRELNVEYPNMYCTMAYPGSKLYENMLEKHPDWLPDSWVGYAQLSYETQPLPTEYLTSAEILAYRDKAFNAFFADNPNYFNMILKKFGQPVVDEINNVMIKGNPRRKILGDNF
jgi:radical SAM superfamily enzyme YgiQ (UPF0313 family)